MPIPRGQLLEFIKSYINTTKCFEKNLEKVKFLSLSNGNCLVELKIEEEHTNSVGGLHGGLSSTLVDSISTFGFLSHEKSKGFNSVSVDLHLTFMKPVFEGDEVLIDAKLNRVGKTLFFYDVLISNKKTKDILVKGSHTKFLIPIK